MTVKCISTTTLFKAVLMAEVKVSKSKPTVKKKSRPKFFICGNYEIYDEGKSPSLTRDDVVDLLNYNPFTHNNNDWF